MQFAAPGAATDGKSARPADLEGHLLLIQPTEYRTGIQTVNGDAEAIACNVIDLDANEEYADTLFFGAGLRAALRNQIGQKVLARIGKGAAKPGKNAPWILIDATGDAAAVKKATDYLAGGLSKPAPVVNNPSVENPLDLNDPAIAALLAQLKK